MCTAVVPGVGSGWEANIARLIDQANETLCSSAYLRHANGDRTPSPHISHRKTIRRSSPLHSAAPTTFRGDRGASYRRGSEGWDASVFMREPGGDRFLPSPPPAPYSNAVAARVEGAKIDGMEDRIKLEVQSNVSRSSPVHQEGRIDCTYSSVSLRLLLLLVYRVPHLHTADIRPYHRTKW